MPLWLGLFLLQESGFFSPFCQSIWCPWFRHAIIHQLWSHSLPRIPPTFPPSYQDFSLSVHSSDEVMTSQIAPSPFSSSFRQEFCSITSAWHFHVFASSSAPHTSIPVRFRAPLCSMLHSFTPLVDKTPLFVRLGLEFFTIFPFLNQTMEAGRILQGYILFLSLSFAS